MRESSGLTFAHTVRYEALHRKRWMLASCGSCIFFDVAEFLYFIFSLFFLYFVTKVGFFLYFNGLKYTYWKRFF